MPIQYAEITIIINLEKEPIMNYFNRLLLRNENQTNDNDTIILLFEDGIICDVTKECTSTKINKLMKMGPNGFDRCNLPLYFEMKDKNETFFSKRPYYNNGIKKMDFKPIFANNKKHMTTKKEPSVYNCIYYVLKDKTDVLSLVKINSNEEKPRFLLAYDDEYFEKDNIICFINYIFSIQ
jgi:hypothetical protein